MSAACWKETAVSELIPIRSVTGRPLPLRGNDIDTDRIIPARFMKAITFDGLGRYSFYDQRFNPRGEELEHPMNDPRYQAKGPRIAIVNKNFGCGSSREHAPQALMRWGVKALVGESFADIFFGNCVALGLPCVTADEASIARLMAAVEQDPAHDMTVDVDGLTVTYRDMKVVVRLPEGTRRQLLEGTWDATRVLLSAEEAVRETASRLPYVRGFVA
jgi:3-isopropylmalate/(R)-2-methylmalate dehydratase small subunit